MKANDIFIKMKVWTMGLNPPLTGRVDCSEGAIIHQLPVSQPSVR